MGRGRRRPQDVPEVEPLDVDGVRTIAVFTMLWAVAFVALALVKGRLDANGNGWWLWACLAGVGLGLLGIEYARKRRDAIADAQLLAEAEDDEDENDDLRDEGDDRHGRDNEPDNEDERPAPRDDVIPRVAEPITDHGPATPSVVPSGPVTDPRAVTRPIESTAPPRVRPAPGTPQAGLTPPATPPVTSPGTRPDLPGAVTTSHGRPAIPSGPPARPAPPNSPPGLPTPPPGLPTPPPGLPTPASGPALPAAPDVPPARPPATPTPVESDWIGGGPGDRLPPRRDIRPYVAQEPPERTHEVLSRERGGQRGRVQSSPDLLDTTSKYTMPTVGPTVGPTGGPTVGPTGGPTVGPVAFDGGSASGLSDADEPLLDDATLGGGRRARRYDVSEEIEAIDDVTEGGGTIYRGRRARREDTA